MSPSVRDGKYAVCVQEVLCDIDQNLVMASSHKTSICINYLSAKADEHSVCVCVFLQGTLVAWEKEKERSENGDSYIYSQTVTATSSQDPH